MPQDLSSCILSAEKAKQDPAALIEIAQDQGIVILPHFLNPGELKNLHREIEAAFTNEKEAPYNFGRARKLRREGDFASKYPQIDQLFGSDWMNGILKHFIPNEFVQNDDVYVTHENVPTQEWALNGHLHFDRLQYYKFFFYMSDVTKSSGAFRCIPGTQDIGKTLREAAWAREANFKRVPNHILNDYSHLGFLEDQALPVEGPAGTLIFFDTDVFHLGGRVEEGQERVVLRGHTSTDRSYAPGY